MEGPIRPNTMFPDVFHNAKKRCKIPYKTCLCRVLGSFSENAMQKHVKSITVIDKSDRHFSTFAKREKPL